MAAISLATLALFALALIKVGTALLVVATRHVPVDYQFLPTTPPSMAVRLLTVGVFAGAGVLLSGFGRRDRRAVRLGIVFLLVATTFSNQILTAATRSGDTGLDFLAGLMAGLNVDALYAWMFWLFVSEFPRASATRIVSSLTRLGAGVAFGVGSTLFLANVLLTLDAMSLDATGTLSAALRSLAFAPAEDAALGLRVLPSAIYYPVLISLGLLALPIALVKTRGAAQVERRRVRWFFTFLWGGALVTVVDIVVLTICEACADAVTRAPGTVLNGLLIYVVLLASPFGVAYAVLVHRVVDVRLAVRLALQYALAKGVIVAAIGLPFVSAAAFIWSHRQRPVSELLAGQRLVVILLAMSIGAALLRGRHRVLKAIDRWFFRDQYDARRLLTDLVDLSRSAPTEQALGMLLRGQIDKALHVESVHVFFVSATRTALIESEDRRLSLDADSTLASLLAGASTPLDCEFGPQGSVPGRLPAADREWLEREHVALLVPMLSGDGKLIGLIALGPKKSELPFSGEDRELLSASAAAAALALENRLLRSSSPRYWPSLDQPTETSDSPDAETPPDVAAECLRCCSLFTTDTATCPSCSTRTTPAHVPFMLSGKFRMRRRVGAGGMGVVYQAVDLALGRRVAIKALPRISSRSADALRREARATASVAHPHLATIYGVETWAGRPLLVLEFFDRGTLADRLAHGPVNVDEARRVGVALADALARAHAAGIIARRYQAEQHRFHR